MISFEDSTIIESNSITNEFLLKMWSIRKFGLISPITVEIDLGLK